MYNIYWKIVKISGLEEVMHIEQMFQNPITREINGVIKAGARDNDTVLEEIKEYVVTTEIRKNMREFFSAYASSFTNKKNENIGIWLAGFFGSGKSHLLKMLGTIIENKSYNGKTVTQYFEEKLGDDKLLLETYQNHHQYLLMLFCLI